MEDSLKCCMKVTVLQTSSFQMKENNFWKAVNPWSAVEYCSSHRTQVNKSFGLWTAEKGSQRGSQEVCWADLVNLDFWTIFYDSALYNSFWSRKPSASVFDDRRNPMLHSRHISQAVLSSTRKLELVVGSRMMNKGTELNTELTDVDRKQEVTCMWSVAAVRNVTEQMIDNL